MRRTRPGARWRASTPTTGCPSSVGFTPDGDGAAGDHQRGRERGPPGALRAGERRSVPSWPAIPSTTSPTSCSRPGPRPRSRPRWCATAPPGSCSTPPTKRDFAALAAQVPGDVGIDSIDRDDRTWLVSSIVDAGSPSYWTYDRAAKRATKLFAIRPALERYTLAPMQPVAYTARDGLTIHGYLTMPAGVAARDLPAVVLRARRALGARHVGLQRHRAVAGQPRLRRAAAELPRLDRLRQSAPQRRRPRVGRRDAHRPARRQGVARRSSGSPTRRGSRSWAAPTAATPRWPRWRSRPTRSPAASTSSARPTSTRC